MNGEEYKQAIRAAHAEYGKGLDEANKEFQREQQAALSEYQSREAIAAQVCFEQKEKVTSRYLEKIMDIEIDFKQSLLKRSRKGE